METQENMIKTALQAAQKPFFEFAPNNTLLVFTPDQDGGWRYKSHPRIDAKPVPQVRQIPHARYRQSY